MALANHYNPRVQTPPWFIEASQLTPTMFLLHTNKLLEDYELDLRCEEDDPDKLCVYLDVLNYYNIEYKDAITTLDQLLKHATTDKEKSRITDALIVIHDYSREMFEINLQDRLEELNRSFNQNYEA